MSQQSAVQPDKEVKSTGPANRTKPRRGKKPFGLRMIVEPIPGKKTWTRGFTLTTWYRTKRDRNNALKARSYWDTCNDMTVRRELVERPSPSSDGAGK